MSISANRAWRSEFGIIPNGQKTFFGSKAELEGSSNASQAHILRRAFDLFLTQQALAGLVEMHISQIRRYESVWLYIRTISAVA
ncbi:MAG TPA: hypothetical protein VMZ52_03635 [Bryobacteraceae bacterium]|nr:hypothetical protein [Bryobacteraceae bacterium]